MTVKYNLKFLLDGELYTPPAYLGVSETIDIDKNDIDSILTGIELIYEELTKIELGEIASDRVIDLYVHNDDEFLFSSLYELELFCRAHRIEFLMSSNLDTYMLVNGIRYRGSVTIDMLNFNKPYSPFPSQESKADLGEPIDLGENEELPF